MPKWRKVKIRLGGSDVAEAMLVPDIGSLDDLGAGIVILIGVVAIAVVVIPLLLFGIELIILGFVIAAGILGRGLLGRPWIVQAVPSGDSTGALAWKVRGWWRSGRMLDEVAASLTNGLEPAPAEAAELISPTSAAERRRS